jgi:hypothetical protein
MEGMIAAVAGKAANQHRIVANEQKARRSRVSEPATESQDVFDQVFGNWQALKSGNIDAARIRPDRYQQSAVLLGAVPGAPLGPGQARPRQAQRHAESTTCAA